MLLPLWLLSLLLGTSLAAPVGDTPDTRDTAPDPLPPPEDDDSAGNSTEEFELTAKSADLVFLVDVTGSMGSYIAGVKDAINKIVEDSNKKEISLRLGFIGYRDPFGRGDIPEEITPEIEEENFEILPFTSSIKDFKEFVSEVRATGGGDGPEDVFGGLEKVGAVEWDSEASKRVLFFIADAPPHGAEFGGWGRQEDGDPLKRDLAELLAPIKEADVQFIFGRVNSDTETMVEKLGEAWGSKLRTFNVAGNRGGWGPPPPPGLPMPMAPPPMDGPGWGPPMEMGLGGGAAFAASGPAGLGGRADSGIAEKIAEAVGEVIV